jgi:tyrocidine synthetase-3
VKNAYIGLMVEDTETLLVGILGILKSGNCLVPINPRFPADRVGFIVRDCQVKILVADQANYARAQQVKETCSCLEHIICIDEIDLSKGIPASNTGETPGAAPMLPRHRQPCYVIYTSGSTGKPKGVPITYENLMPLLLWFHEYFGLGSHTRVLQNLSYTFDFGFFELVTTLLTGGVLYFFDKQTMSDVNEYVDFIFRHQIDTIHTTPSFFINIIGLSRELSPVKLLHFGGERLTGKMVREVSGKIGKPGYIYNGYGPTETTINSAIYSIRVEETGSLQLPDNIPIGKPSANNTIFICDAYGNLQPPGVTGELYIGGSSVSQGYINRPELTREKFIFHRSYRTNRTYISKKVYKTGDLGRWLPGGDIEFLGRVDHQVKIRGFRIELGEIESRLLRCKRITDAVVIDIDRDTGGEDKYLCAYVVSEHRGDNTEIDELRQELAADLPDYMVPGYFVFLDKIPLTPNGKVDRRALPLPGQVEATGAAGEGRKAAQPQDHFQETLLRLWQEVLPLENFPADVLGIDDSFFHFGGDSLKAVLLVSKVHKAFDVKMPLWEVFRRPTAREMAHYIENAGKEWFVSIVPQEKKEYYSLSSAQKRLSFLQQLEPGGIGYNMPMAFGLTGEVNKEKLADTFRQLIRRHESLRTSFPVIEGESVQRIHDEVEFEIEYDDLLVAGAGDRRMWSSILEGTGGLAPLSEESAVSGSRLAASTIKDFIRPFDLSRAPLLRVGLAELQPTPSAPRSHPSGTLPTPSSLRSHPSREGRSILMIDMHHIISDAVSLDIFTRDFMALYAGEVLPRLRIDYKDYTQWQNQEKYKNKIRSQEDFWIGEFKEEIPILDLPIDFPRPMLQSFAGRHLFFQLDEEKTRALKRLTTAADATLYMLLITLFNILLAKISGQEDIVLGSPLAGRRHADLEPIIGMFVNTLVPRNYPTGEKTFTGFLKEVRERTLTALENQDYQFEDLVEKLVINRDLSRNPLFDAMLVLQNASISKIDIPGLELKPYQYEAGISKFDLTFTCEELEDRLVFTVEFSTKLFLESTIERFIDYFKKIISTVVDNKDIRIGQIEILSGAERSRALQDFNDTAVEYPADQLIHRLFENQAGNTPDRVVLVERMAGPPVQSKKENYPGPGPGPGPRAITYRELNERSNQLAQISRKQGVKANTAVGIMMERCTEMLMVIMAVLKAGGVYLPIDPEYPDQRIVLMLTDPGASILFTRREILEGKSLNLIYRQPHLQVTAVEELNDRLQQESRDNSPSMAGPDDLIYIIFTSGSTGTPKGAGVYHRGFMNLMHWFVTDFGLQAGDTNLLLTSLSFDLTQKNLYASLVTGGVLCIPGFNYFDPGTLLEEIYDNRVTWINCTPSMFYMLVEYEESGEKKRLSSLRYVFLGGEPISVPKLISWLESGQCHAEIVNTYGPTECTDICASYRIREPRRFLEENVPLGRPIYNVRLFVLNKDRQPLPVGIVGELAIGGAGVGSGYVNDEALTARKFLSLSFSADEPGTLLYLTGDRVKWREDGNIEFLGRLDFQVKVRGYRIEIGEIENRLAANESVEEAVVVARSDTAGANYLCAYVVPAAGKEFQAEVLRKELNQVLPGYMVPSFFVPLDKFPLTPSGKVDRKLLPLPGPGVPGKEYTAPRSRTETKLAVLWSELLGIEKERLSIEGNFFDLGGHSLKATRLISKIHKALNVKVPLAEIFKSPTIRGLSQYIDASVKERYVFISPAEKKDYYQLSPAQRRLYILYQIDPGGIGYNIPAVMELEGNFKTERIENVFMKLIRRHESFRTSFLVMDGEPVQRVHDEVKFQVEYYDRKEVEGKKEEVEDGDTEGTRGLAPLSVEIADRNAQSAGRKEERHAPCAVRCASTIKNFIRPFDLSQAPLLRVRLITLSHTPTTPGHHPSGTLPTPAALRSHPSREGKSILMLDMHHIIADGTSMNVLIKDFITLYRGQELPGPRIRYTYKDFALWQNSKKEKKFLEDQEKYWLKEFAGEIPILDLPIDFTRPALQSFEGNRVKFEIEKGLTEKLKSLAAREESTLFMVLLALFNLFLSKLSGQEQIIVGAPVAGRRNAGLEEIIGMFINTLALRNYPVGGKTFTGFLKEVKENTLAAFENQDYPFEELVEKVNVKRDVGRNPLFDVMFALQNIDITGLNRGITADDLRLKLFEYNSNISKFDLVVICEESGDNGESLDFVVEYCTKLLKKQTIHRFIEYFKRLINVVSITPGLKLAEVEIISTAEKQEILVGLNRVDPGYPYPGDFTIRQLFEAQAEKTPDRTAVVGSWHYMSAVDKGESVPLTGAILTYSELNKNSRQLARLLRAKGVEPETTAGIMVDRSIEMIIGILGILKTGGAYLPINPKNPAARKHFMLRDSNAKVLVTTCSLNKEVKKLGSWKDKTCFIEDAVQPTARSTQPGTCELQPAANPGNLAYIIYTSGSTGNPKGVPITHSNFSPLMHWGYRHMKLTPADCSLQNLSYYFDWSVWEIFITLTSGASLYMIPEEVVLDPRAQLQFIETNAITVLHITPTHFQALVNENLARGGNPLASLTCLAIGAEKLTYDLVSRTCALVGHHCRVFNMYGPTEATIMSAVLEIDKAGREKYKPLSSVPIGITIANSDLLVLSKYWQVCPVNIVGELFIAGEALARGYLNDVEKTSAAFVKNPFETEGIKGKHLYKTGDLVRWLPDGTIEFLGRGDNQVKIRGYRIELGEIENQLLEHKDVKEAAVIDRKRENGETYICSYIVTSETFTANGGIKEVKKFLSQSLPDYMIPSAFVILDRMPLNPNKKIDRNALPEPKFEASLQDDEAPRDEIERKLAAIWSDLLGVDKQGISIDANFFELGGHSLKATLMTASIHKIFQVKLPLAEIFKNPTIREFAALISSSGKTTFADLETSEEKDFYELSYNQRRLWLLHQVEPESSSYNLPGRIELDHAVDENMVKNALYKMVERHESLRTGFKIVNAEPVQYIVKAREVKIPFKKIDITSQLEETQKQEKREQIYAQEAGIPIELNQVPLFRALLLKWGETHYDFIFNMHHIITDGWSIEVLKREFLQYYHGLRKGNAYQPQPLKLQYKDFAAWHNRQLGQPQHKEQSKRFWKNIFKDGVPALQLPVNPQGNPGDLTGAAFQWIIDKDTKNQLKHLAQTNHTTLFTLMFSLYLMLLSRLSNQKEVICSIIAAGRDQVSLQPIVGFFVNSILFKTHVDDEENFIDFLRRVNTEVVETFQHQDYPLELVFKELKMKHPDVPASFNMLNILDAADHLQIPPHQHMENIQDVKFDIEVYISEYENGILLYWAYKKSLYDPIDIEYTVGQYINLVDFFKDNFQHSYAQYKSAKKKKKKLLDRRN